MRALLAGGCLLAATACAGHPSDEECIARFFAHQARFERLRELASTEPGSGGLTRASVVESLNAARSDAERERWNEYLSLFDELGLRDGIVRTSQVPLVIEFGPSTPKRIYYSEVEPAPLVHRLDDVGAVRSACRCDAAFRMIDGNWYIMLEL